MGLLQPLEKPLEDINKQLPKLPKSFKDFLVQIVPWLTLLAAVLALWTAWGVWQWARIASWVSSWASAVGVGGVSRWSVMIYLSLGALIVAVIIYALAFSPLRTYAKKGWDLLFLGIAVNFVYGIFVAFSLYGGFGSFLGQLIGTAIALYLLFQVRDYYTGKEKVAASAKFGANTQAPSSQKSDDTK